MSFTSDFDRPPFSSFQAASRFDPYFDIYGLSLKHEPAEKQRTITLIARSPASPPAQALAMNIGRFQPFSIDVRIIFAQIAPAAALNLILQALSQCCTQSPESTIRWAKNRALLEAHERLTLGRALCWTGDSMRRSEDSRSAIDRVDEGTPGVIAEARASFIALWEASKPLPGTLFSRNSGVHSEPSSGASVETPPPFTTNSNIVHLEDFLRIRRH